MRRGFSLVELSIVLVILGLLTGGILAGQSLIRASELRSVTADLTRYQTAFYSFRDKYFALPGDFTQAEAFWGSDAGCPATAANTVTKTATCNGNGNGIIYHNGGGNYEESYRAWQHLANAGMIEGSYSGVISTAGAPLSTIPGVNAPKGKMANTGFQVQTLRNYAGNGTWWPSDYGTMLQFGMANGTNWTYSAVLKAEEMWGIDVKLDDGRPGYGKVMSLRKSYQPCADSDDFTTAQYDVTASGTSCSLQFKMGL